MPIVDPTKYAGQQPIPYQPPKTQQWNPYDTGQYGNTDPYGMPQPTSTRTGSINATNTGGNISITGGFQTNGGTYPQVQTSMRAAAPKGDAPATYTGAGWEQQKMNDQSTKLQQERQFRHEEEMARLQAQYAAEAQRQKMNMLSNFSLNASGFGGSGGPNPGHVNLQTVMLPSQSFGNVGPVQMPDLSAAQAAAFARAKDQVGEISTGALSGLRSALGGRGMLGSGNELRGTQNIAMKGLGQLGEVSREQAIQDAEARREGALTSYQGDIQQRAQNLQNMQATNDLNTRLALGQYQGAISQRQQDMDMARSQQEAQWKILQGLLGAII